MEKLFETILIAGISGSIAGLIAWGGVKSDIRWLKDGLREIRELFFNHINDTKDL